VSEFSKGREGALRFGWPAQFNLSCMETARPTHTGNFSRALNASGHPFIIDTLYSTATIKICKDMTTVNIGD
jgi:hypothetical protein